MNDIVERYNEFRSRLIAHLGYHQDTHGNCSTLLSSVSSRKAANLAPYIVMDALTLIEHYRMAIAAYEEARVADAHYMLSCEHMNKLEIATLNTLINLTRHGAKFIDVRVRKDAVEYEFQADFLKYLEARCVPDIGNDVKSYRIHQPPQKAGTDE